MASGGTAAHSEHPATSAATVVAPDLIDSRVAPPPASAAGGADMSTVVRPPDLQGPPPSRSRRSLVVALVLAIVLMGAGVAVFLTRDSSPSASPQGVSSQGTQPKTDEQKIVDAVKSYYKVDDEAFRGPDPDDPRYTLYATGPQLQAAVDAARKAKAQGLAGRKPANSITDQKVTVVSITGDQAQIRVCSVDDGYIVKADTGKPAYDYPPGFAVTALMSGQMVRDNGVWKLYTLKQDQRWDGVAGCAVGQA